MANNTMIEKARDDSSRVVAICDVADCVTRVYALGLCWMHRWRQRVHGDVNYSIRKLGIGSTPVERFWSRVDKSGGEDSCWPWQGTLMNKGYGTLRIGGRRWLTHRFALFLDLGRELEGLVLHACDNPPCCNPKHLREGTHSDNVRDAIERGRRK